MPSFLCNILCFSCPTHKLENSLRSGQSVAAAHPLEQDGPALSTVNILAGQALTPTTPIPGRRVFVEFAPMAHAKDQRAARLNPFIKGGCGVDGGLLSDSDLHFNLAFPSPLPPDLQPQRRPSQPSLFMLQRECSLIQAAPLESYGPGQQTSNPCGREHGHAEYGPESQLAFAIAQSVRRSRHAKSGSRSCITD